MDELTLFQGRRVLVTGHTGFKGAWLSLWLLERGARVAGFSLDVPTEPSLFESIDVAREVRHHVGDVRDADAFKRVLDRERPEIVFHLAGQPIVRRSYRQPKETFDVNVGGTVNVLECVRRSSFVRVLVLATSDKCYEQQGGVWGFRENDRLGGADPYSASKACAELVIAAYRQAFFAPERVTEHGVGLASVRAGNVIGGGDWAPDRLVPDCIRALTLGKSIPIRRPHAVRPWQHVLEPLAGYLILATRLWENPRDYGGAWNFGPPTESARPVLDLVRTLIRAWGAGRWRVTGQPTEPEADCLRLCSDKALAQLPWRPQWSLREAVEHATDWYRAFYHNEPAGRLRDLCRRQIKDYELSWSRSAGFAQPTQLACVETAGPRKRARVCA